jgi:hypothetical protein
MPSQEPTASTTYLVLKEVAGHSPTHLDPLQQLLAPHVDTLINIWISIWCMTAVVLLYKLWHEYREQKQRR